MKSPVICGHVRAASDGRNHTENVIVNYENCHPFRYKRYTMVHNGGIPSFCKIKRELCNLLSEEFFENISGTTDSEHIFGLFLNSLPNCTEQLPLCDLTQAVNETISTLKRLCSSHNITCGISLNMLFTDGVHVIATRYRATDSGCAGEEPPSLYFNYGHNFCPKTGNFTDTIQNPNRYEILVSSSPLNTSGVHVDCLKTMQCNVSNRWSLIPNNHMLVCVGNVDDLSIVTGHMMIPIRIGPPRISSHKTFSIPDFAQLLLDTTNQDTNTDKEESSDSVTYPTSILLFCADIHS